MSEIDAIAYQLHGLGDKLDRLVGEQTINLSAEEVMSMMQVTSAAAGVAENGNDQLT